MSLYTARTIGGGTDAIGTTLPTFRLGLTGPTFYNGSADPTVTPPTPMDDGFSDGDIYIRGTAGGSALWVLDTAVWTQIASGAGGGSFAGDIIMVASAQLLGDIAADATAPAFAFNGDEDTGIFQVGANELGFSTGGTQALIIESNGTIASTVAGYESLVISDNDIPNRKYVEDTFVNISGDGMTGDLAFGPGTQLLVASGDATDPGIAFALDLNTGFYLEGADSIGVASGAQIASFDSVGIRMRNNAQFVGDSGAVGAPSIAFDTDLNTGILHDSTIGEIALVSAGTEMIRFDGTSADGTLLWRGGDGSNGAPAISFSADPDTGFNRSGTGAITFNSDATPACNISISGVDTVNGTAALPAFAFISETSTGMYRSAVNELAFSVAGVQRWRINATGDLLPTAVGADIATSGTRLATVYATTFDGTATAAQYSDLAERYSVGPDCDLVPGDVVIICDHEGHDICCSHAADDDRVLGVVSTKPAFMMNKDAGDDKTAPYIALRGRVPVKVYGTVYKGDLLVTSDYEGCARALSDEEKKTVSPHAVFAKALSTHTAYGYGEVEAVIL